VIVSPEGGGFVGATDEALAKVGLSRRVVLSVPHFLYLESVLASTDLVAMLPARLVRDNDRLQIVDAPVEVPGFEMSMLWHERVIATPRISGCGSRSWRRCDRVADGSGPVMVV
jgi:DNA-binding transcriptional LysR family regulator